jgi:hypothetical protein
MDDETKRKYRVGRYNIFDDTLENSQNCLVYKSYFIVDCEPLAFYIYSARISKVERFVQNEAQSYSQK